MKVRDKILKRYDLVNKALILQYKSHNAKIGKNYEYEKLHASLLNDEYDKITKKIKIILNEIIALDKKISYLFKKENSKELWDVVMSLPEPNEKNWERYELSGWGKRFVQFKCKRSGYSFRNEYINYVFGSETRKLLEDLALFEQKKYEYIKCNPIAFTYIT